MSSKGVRSWLVPLFLAGVMFVVIRPRMVQALTREEIHGLFLASQDVQVRVVGKEGELSQIEYELGEEVQVVSEGSLVNAEPDIQGEYIVWMARVGVNWQIFRYSLVTRETVQLTGVGNNVNPAVYGGKVVWEGFVDGAWQVFLFDGVSVRQVTRGESIEEVDLYEGWLSYRQKTEDGRGWRVKVENLLTGDKVDVGEGAEPRFEEGELVWVVEQGGRGVEQRFVLSVDVDVEVEEASISGVLEATGSGEVD